MNAPLLSVTDLRTWIDSAAGTVRAIDGLDLELRRGETFALVGESGCGKSMTALSILRLLPEAAAIMSGEAMLAAQAKAAPAAPATDMFDLPERLMRDVRGRRIAMIFQEPATSLNPVLTVREQLMEVILRHGIATGEAAVARARALLDAVGIPDSTRRLGEYPFQLSGGLKQRVMIACALAAEPDILVADEPTTALDVTIQAQIVDLIKEIQHSRGMSVLLITHDLGVVAQMAHRVAVMYAGQIVEVGSREQFFAAPRHPYSRKLFAALPDASKRRAELEVIRGSVPPLTAEFRACRFLERCDHAVPACGASAPQLRDVGAGHQARCFLVEQGLLPTSRPGSTASASVPVAAPAAGAEPLLSVEGLKVHFPIRKGLLKRTVGQVKAVDAVSLAIAPGRTLALVGESGCGKTTAGKAILQLLQPTAGSVRFDGAELVGMGAAALRARRAEFQIIFQDPYASLNPRMRVSDILAEGLQALAGEMADADRAARIVELLGQVGLPADAGSRYPHEFSGGQRQRIAIARALAVRPRLIVCDEPTSALDVSVQAQILNLLKRLQDELGIAYLFITHNIAVVEYLAHEVAVMYLGRIVEHGPAAQVLEAPRHPYTRALLGAVPRIDLSGAPAPRLAGELPSPVNPPAGCHFHPRCAEARPECRERYPEASRMPDGVSVACWLHGEGRRG